MKILFALNHPAHYHLFKHSFSILRQKGHDTVFVVKNKDILTELLLSENVVFHVLTQKRVGHGKTAVLVKGSVEIIVQGCKLFFFCRKYKPDLMVGTDYSITHVGKLLGIESIVFNEDDYNINKLFCKLAYPFATKIVSPLVCDVGKYSHKKVAYDGFQKLAYLHPSYFQPDMKVVKKYFDSTKKTYLIRIVQFSAGHDIEMNHSGISIQLLEKICTILEKQGQVYISSESRLPDHLQKYKLEINPKDIHHLLSFVDIFIADSQSMIVEAAMLGTPCIRFNSFVGKISVLEELEKKYKLAIGVHSCEPHELVRQLKLLLTQEDIKCVYNRRRDKMLKDKIDLTVFAVKLFHNYPQSISKK